MHAHNIYFNKHNNSITFHSKCRFIDWMIQCSEMKKEKENVKCLFEQKHFQKKRNSSS